ncbi:probable (S)-N-methylcoclaurine 3'-hydroxylase isozyme 2 [Cynara cardunculus var. scolymus]|uniref:probable (S)-N-methylcoclaurine 3'-hydroxylase isozyme 2 n=1 Tax=Cynara cardunculus var. scolymus TaxID=59895 RepID=UPI000D6274A8|nr:probable (S)-N-methylcoclaurine 3'-hydroxylase isozyme 2 [Cynara cardunculus var. scolymus]
MDIAITLGENYFSFLLVFLLTSFFLFSIAKTTFRSKQNIPPGPWRWPIIGNMHQVGKDPHVVTAVLAQRHGPLISLHLGTQLLVVAASPEAALEILKTKDRFTSSRFVPNAFQSYLLPFTLIWSTDCDENWKSLRTLCRTEMFSSKALESQSSLRAKKLAQMLDFLCEKKGEVVSIEGVVFTTMFNTLSNIFFGKDFLDLDDKNGSDGGLREQLFKTLATGVTPNVSDFFPMLARLDLQGLRTKNLKHVKGIFNSWERIIDERRSMVAVAEGEQCFVDCLLENGFSNDQISMLGLELFTAGTDTTTSTVEWAMAELVKNKNVMSKLREELKNEINTRTVVESEVSNLPYLNACIKETLRLHPPAPFLLPHRAYQTCEVMDYTLPRGSQILVNIWAIGRDPKLWEDPLLFKPERFLGSNLDFGGQNFEFIPFGAGRRMCPGLQSGVKSVQTILASLILRFDWLLPNDDDPVNLDMSEKFGVFLQKKKPLQLIFKDLK